MKKTLERSLEIGLLVAIGAVLYLLFGPMLFHTHHERNSAEVRALFESLDLGMTREQVRQAMDPRKYSHLEFRHDDGQWWSAETPMEFGAGNWVLAIEFQGDHVSMLRIRTADGDQDYHHPEDAPPDKGRRSTGSDKGP